MDKKTPNLNGLFTRTPLGPHQTFAQQGSHGPSPDNFTAKEGKNGFVGDKYDPFSKKTILPPLKARKNKKAHKGKGKANGLAQLIAGATASPMASSLIKKRMSISRAESVIYFTKTSPNVMKSLMDKFGITDFQSAGILGNLGHESIGLTKMQEVLSQDKIDRGWKGGWGWAQWTAVRRKAFFKWCEENNLEPSSIEANRGFLEYELRTTHKGSIKVLKNAENIEDATKIFMDSYEGPGVEHLDSRINWARKAFDAYQNLNKKGD